MNDNDQYSLRGRTVFNRLRRKTYLQGLSEENCELKEAAIRVKSWVFQNTITMNWS